jgi:hypothetical protein
MIEDGVSCPFFQLYPGICLTAVEKHGKPVGVAQFTPYQLYTCNTTTTRCETVLPQQLF